MALKTEQIVKILQLKGLGRKTAFLICEKAINEVIDCDNDLQELLLEYLDKKWIKRVKFTKEDISTAFHKGDEILDNSLNSGIKIVSYYDNSYPQILKDIPDKPIVLNFIGDYQSLNKLTGVAIIGTREPTLEGIHSGEYFGKTFGGSGYNVVSGLALGCDTAAHRGCLKGKGYTTAILAHGLHTIFPKENKYLAEDIISSGGVLLSEYFFGVGALRNFFVERDRLQSGLSKATIVIQTAETGGTMHAVNATLASKNLLAAVKYKSDLKSEKVLGNEMLIREKDAFSLTSQNTQEFIALLEGRKNQTNNELKNSNLQKSREIDRVSQSAKNDETNNGSSGNKKNSGGDQLKIGF